MGTDGKTSLGTDAVPVEHRYRYRKRHCSASRTLVQVQTYRISTVPVEYRVHNPHCSKQLYIIKGEEGGKTKAHIDMQSGADIYHAILSLPKWLRSSKACEYP